MPKIFVESMNQWILKHYSSQRYYLPLWRIIISGIKCPGAGELLLLWCLSCTCPYLWALVILYFPRFVSSKFLFKFSRINLYHNVEYAFQATHAPNPRTDVLFHSPFLRIMNSGPKDSQKTLEKMMSGRFFFFLRKNSSSWVSALDNRV